MKKFMIGLLVAFVIIIMLLGGGYLGLAEYYEEKFALNTWINGNYCTGLTVEEVNEMLLAETKKPEDFMIVGYASKGAAPEKKTWVISMEDLQYTMDYEPAIKEFFQKQDPWSWLDYVGLKRNLVIKPEFYMNEKVLEEQWKEIASGLWDEDDYRVEYSEEKGYFLVDKLHNQLDEQKAYAAILEAIYNRKDSVDLTEKECYYDLSFTWQQEDQVKLWNKLAYYQENAPFYDFGDGIKQIDASWMARFLLQDGYTMMPVMNEKGGFVLRENCAEEWVEEMARIYDTYDKEWVFQSTRGESVKIQGGTYGTTIDRRQEIQWLSNYLQQLVEECARQGNYNSASAKAIPEKTEALQMMASEINEAGEQMEARAQEVHKPEYIREAYDRGSKGIGDTYIEVDMGIQKLYYYEKGELKLETDVVTGNARQRMNTPEGVNYVYSKQKNRILRGEGYTSPVKFWMPVKGAIGIHDATWRKEFGGDIYKTNGSHGCINVELKQMAELFDMVEIGTPVVMFYGEEI